MGIVHGGYVVADFSPGGVSGWPGGLGVHRLRFSVNYSSGGHGRSCVVRNFRAKVSVSRTHQNFSHLGLAWPESAWILQVHPSASKAAIQFDIDLTSEQLSRIEQLRSGGELCFKLEFLCESSSSDFIEQGSDELLFRVNQSAWVACLGQLGQDQIMLLEVELPLIPDELGAAVSMLKDARQELLAGNYDGVVQKCRRAIESARKSLKISADVATAVNDFRQGDRKKMSKRARALLVNEAALHYAHPAAHVDDDGSEFEYGRRDAMFMLALASAVVSNGQAD